MELGKQLTKEEIKRLLILAYLGEWVVNAHAQGDEARPEYTSILEKMLSLAHQAGLDEYVAWRNAVKKIDASFLLEEKCQKFLAEYGEKFFKEEFEDRFPAMDIQALMRKQQK